jgi:hypothetical protein
MEAAMPAKRPSNAELVWRAAEDALEAARQLPAGVERFEALKKAGKPRFDADIESPRNRSGQKQRLSERLALEPISVGHPK